MDEEHHQKELREAYLIARKELAEDIISLIKSEGDYEFQLREVGIICQTAINTYYQSRNKDLKTV